MGAMKLSLASLFLGLVVLSLQNQEAPRVKTPFGAIRGEYRKSQHGRTYEAYEGIPYAEPPLGRLRFQPPKPVKKWLYELPATKKGSICTQFLMSPLNGDRVTGCEDCLYLNIYVPSRTDNKTLPVIFWIHGGAFQFSTFNEVNETRLMDRKVILITSNYRLGPFGFLSTGDRVVPGNMGLKDQSTALLWVSENIIHFGGNSKNITLIGLSAGGASVHFHYMSPLSAGLFQRGISISGVALDSWVQTERAPDKAKKLGALMGCPTNSTYRMVDCLRHRPARLISQAVGEFMFWLYNPFTPFGTVIEHQKCPKPFITDSPIELIRQGKLMDVPWISGVVSEEGLYPAAEFVADDKLLKHLNDNWDDIAPYLLDYNNTIPLSQHKDVAEKARKHYLGSKEISRHTTRQLIHMIGDRLFSSDFEKAVRLQAAVNKSPVWAYYYTYRATHSLSEFLSKLGVSHADDAFLIFNTQIANTTKPEDLRMQKLLVDFYISFAINGKPKIGHAKWKALNHEDERFRFLRIAGPRNISMTCSNNFAEKKFWNTINFDENTINYNIAEMSSIVESE
ncbi:PREDICTED: venom carboxylesterase-6-like [Dufourea novaeangliae]|uniref:venom carboxylesterase-6-like n=1 Tax=Dufourea novaeangliae TaxID=178035 RepID=UPI000767560E|nr:PREDICTED: venom carboxylesterase-6-like [Dufourea novaeangliae]